MRRPSIDVPIAHVWRVRDGCAVRAELCIEEATMLAALATGRPS